MFRYVKKTVTIQNRWKYISLEILKKYFRTYLVYVYYFILESQLLPQKHKVYPWVMTFSSYKLFTTDDYLICKFNIFCHRVKERIFSNSFCTRIHLTKTQKSTFKYCSHA